MKKRINQNIDIAVSTIKFLINFLLLKMILLT